MILISIYFTILFFGYSFVLVSIKKIYQTFETVFYHISKHLEFRQKYSAWRRIFNSFLSVWKCDGALSRMFDIVRQINKILVYKLLLKLIVFVLLLIIKC